MICILRDAESSRDRMTNALETCTGIRLMQGDEMANIKFSLGNSPSIWNHFLSFSFFVFACFVYFLFLFIISFGIHKVTASFIVTGLSPSPAGLHRHSPKKSKQPTTTIILDIPRIDHDVLASRQPGAEELLRRMPNAECRIHPFSLAQQMRSTDRVRQETRNESKERRSRIKIKRKMGRPVFLCTGNGPG